MCPKYRSLAHTGRYKGWKRHSHLGAGLWPAQSHPAPAVPPCPPSGESRETLCLSLPQAEHPFQCQSDSKLFSVRPHIASWRETSWDSGMESLLFWEKMACSEKLLCLCSKCLCLNTTSAACSSSKRVQ